CGDSVGHEQKAQFRRFVVKEHAGQDHAPEPADQRHDEERLLAYSPLAICRPSLVDAHREEADYARQKEPDSKYLQREVAGDALDMIEEVVKLIKHKRFPYPGFILPVGL